MGITRKQLVVVVVLIAGATIAVLNQTLLSPAFPSIMADLNVDASTVQWLTSAYSLVEAIVIPLSAYLVGRFPTRRLFIFGISLFAVGSLCAALAPVFAVLLLGRVLQAAACGVVMPMVFTVVLVIFPRERRGQAMGIVSLVIGFAPAVGPSISGLLVDSVGWRFLFVLVFVLAAIIVICACVFLESYGDFEPTSFDKLSVVLVLCGLLSLLYGLSTIASSSYPLVSIALIVIGLVLLALFVRRQLKLEVPLLKVTVLEARNYRCAVIIVAMLQAALVGIGVLLPIYLQNLLGISALGTGLIMLPGAVLGAVFGYVAGRMFDKAGARRVIVPAAVVAALGGCGLVGFSLDSSVVYIIAVYTLLGVGMQAIMTPLNTWGLNSLDNRVIQHANSLQNTTNQIGASLGTAILVSLSATSAIFFPDLAGAEQTMVGDRIAFAFTALLMVAVLVIVCIVVRDGKGSSDAQSANEAAADIAGDGAITVGAVMNRDPYFVRDADSIRDVARILSEKKTGGVPVVDGDNRVVGFVSDGDIMKYIGHSDAAVLDATIVMYRVSDNEDFAQRVRDLIGLNVMRIATKHVVSARPGMELDEVCKVMAEKRIKKMPVVSPDGSLVGSLSRCDIIRSTMSNLVAVESSSKTGGASTR